MLLAVGGRKLGGGTGQADHLSRQLSVQIFPPPYKNSREGETNGPDTLGRISRSTLSLPAVHRF